MIINLTICGLLISLMAVQWFKRTAKINTKINPKINTKTNNKLGRKRKLSWNEQTKNKFEILRNKTVQIKDFSKFKQSDIENITLLNTLINEYISKIFSGVDNFSQNYLIKFNQNKSYLSQNNYECCNSHSSDENSKNTQCRNSEVTSKYNNGKILKNQFDDEGSFSTDFCDQSFEFKVTKQPRNVRFNDDITSFI